MRPWRFRPWPTRSHLEPFLQAGFTPFLAALLASRGFKRPEDLSPPLEPPNLPSLDQAARRLLLAFERGERIRIHGDYDADGLTGTAILLRGLRALGAQVHAFIPHRLLEGYGISTQRLEEHRAAAELLLTVDCGISNTRELAFLHEQGMGIVVTDHHTPGDHLPPGLVVHPSLSALPPPHPSGAGLAFWLLWRLHELLDQPPPLEYTDLAALGTVADVVPLQGSNRAIVQRGLDQLARSRWIGLRLLVQRCAPRQLTAQEIAFRIAPRINAAGRLGAAELALELLTSDDPERCALLVEALEEKNRERQRLEDEMLRRAEARIDLQKPALVLDDPEGHPGVMGIVAGRLLERYRKPAFISVGGKGSVRSLPGLSAVDALHWASSYLAHYGGHLQAAGFQLKDPRAFAEFAQAIWAYAERFPPELPPLILDGPLPQGSEGAALLGQAHQLLGPFGEGNPELLFYLAGEALDPMRSRDGKHLFFRLEHLRVASWHDEGELPEGPIELAVSLLIGETLELTAQAYRSPQPWEMGWVTFLSPQQALQEAKQSGAGVYIDPGAVFWAKEQGLTPVAPSQAEYWLSLPPSGPPPARTVRIALTQRTLSALESDPHPLRRALGQRLAWAYRKKMGALFCESLERLWELEVPPEQVEREEIET